MERSGATRRGSCAADRRSLSYPFGEHRLHGRTALLDWLTAPATDADRFRLARLLASGRADAVTAALQRLAEHRAAGEVLVTWQQAAADLLAVSSRPTLRSACLAEAARLRSETIQPRPSVGSCERAALAGGVRRYGPPPRLQGAKGKTVRWRHVPTPA